MLLEQLRACWLQRRWQTGELAELVALIESLGVVKNQPCHHIPSRRYLAESYLPQPANAYERPAVVRFETLHPLALFAIEKCDYLRANASIVVAHPLDSIASMLPQSDQRNDPFAFDVLSRLSGCAERSEHAKPVKNCPHLQTADTLWAIAAPRLAPISQLLVIATDPSDLVPPDNPVELTIHSPL
jgi:hypothetical protein